MSALPELPDASRVAFEAWKKSLPDDGCEGPTPFEIWQASRKQALEEARETVHCIALARTGTALECETAIGRIK